MDDFNCQQQVDEQAYADWMEMMMYNRDIIDEEDWIAIVDSDVDQHDVEDLPF